MRLLSLLLLSGCTAELVVGQADTAEQGLVQPPGTGTGTGTGGAIPDDADGDGYTTAEDCDDTDPDVNPGTAERCNGVDDDCDGATDGDVCPCATESWQGHVYAFCRDALPWLEARGVCGDAGMHLVSLETEAEQDAVVLGTGGGPGSSWWIGLSDYLSEGTWQWESGAPLTFESWAPGEPNDFGQQGEDCAQLMAGSGTWNDLSCDAAQPFVCESR